MEAPKLKQLLKVAEKRNPNWYPFISGYLHGALDNIYNIDNSELEINEQQLDLGNYDSCVVGEVFDFSADYIHNNMSALEDHKGCVICESFGQRLYNNAGSEDNGLDSDYQRDQFADILKQFYKHMEYMK